MATLEQIDEEIKSQRVLLANLGRRNSFSPIFRLPPETLENIFTLGVHDYYVQYLKRRLPLCVPHWVNVSYVCRHWRDVALNCTTLWSYHFIVSLRWTEELLARSKQTSLKICLNSRSKLRRTEYWLLDLLRKLLSHAEQIQELRLRVPDGVLPSRLSLHAPRLQVLDIDGTLANDFYRTLTISDGNTPFLRTLKLTDCPLRWDSLDMSRLTTLFLRRVPDRSQQHITELLAVLRRTQSLTVLHLEDALPAARDFLSGGGLGVSTDLGLPCLARLFVDAPLSTLILLLSCVNIPLKTEVRLRFGLENGSFFEDYAQIPPILAQRFSRDPSQTIRSLAIRSRLSEPGFALWVSERDSCYPSLSMKNPRWDVNIPLVVIVEMQRAMVIRKMLWDHILGDICCSIPSANVQTLHIVYPPCSLGFWRKMLHYFCGLQRIELSRGHLPDLASLLALTADGPADPLKGTSNHDLAPGYTFVPALKDLELYCVKIAFKGKTLYEPLLHALSARKATCPQLNMIDCLSDSEDSGTEYEDASETCDSEWSDEGSESESESDDMGWI